MDATCTPGLPTVVTTLVRVTDLPAAAPLSTLIDAEAAMADALPGCWPSDARLGIGAVWL